MVIVANKTLIRKGEGHKLVKRFDKIGKIEMQKGFLGLEVLVNAKEKDVDEVTISTRWETKADFHAWTKSEAFREAHSGRNARPDYILGNEIEFYNVEVVRMPIAQAQ
ncbi:heme oxygenase [Shouchella clausii]|jgi:heme oxygenase (staphylobilin-producing)|uniref:Heme-degrading monooxygenase n=1 Tax=Shouchella clausii TaxID=79880 RepID=A0A268RVI4_SHOCL|nr:heme oxygenase [Shouchella clausii]PAD41173.1 heme-degrading monooxygenase IsdG [Bacillus sp. 7520-S]AST96363.1 heme-degrading monooxygenase IsdG [Shouchella clausii]MBU8596862.1 heme oxygenase [Shouchella clausii]MCR1287659.1 heme oxygenase [Shouchella clausii]MEB5471294.1 heme oxygenase [Shouchella clausii]